MGIYLVDSMNSCMHGTSIIQEYQAMYSLKYLFCWEILFAGIFTE